ncbi:histidine kinase domain protein, partial [Vibrio parahaemolyticus V-223/04]
AKRLKSHKKSTTNWRSLNKFPICLAMTHACLKPLRKVHRRQN